MTNTTKTPLHLYDNDMLFWRDENRQMNMAIHVQIDPEPLNPRGYDNDDIMFCHHSRYNLGDNTHDKTLGAFWARIISEHMTNDHIAAKLIKKDPVRGYNSTILDKCRALACSTAELENELITELTEDFLDYIRETDAIDAAIDVSQDDIAALPLWLYDHSGITMSCGERMYPYNDKYDSSGVGWIVMPKSVAMRNITCPVDKDGKPCHQNPATYVPCTDANWKHAAIRHMRHSVKIYDLYLQGEFYGYTLYERPAETCDPKTEPKCTYEQDWTELDCCWGIPGKDITKNEILEDIGYGLKEALTSGNYKTGKASASQIIIWQFQENE